MQRVSVSAGTPQMGRCIQYRVGYVSFQLLREGQRIVPAQPKQFLQGRATTPNSWKEDLEAAQAAPF